jgi:energy-coupling factor transporter transmembrane protein EcfT
MTVRGFDGAFPVTRKFAWRLHDTVSLMLCALAAALVILG